MKKFFGILVLSAVVGLPVTPVLGGAPLVSSGQKLQAANDVVLVGKLRHRHRHCHIVVTLGHARKRCHTHRHNKVVHHGPRYH